MWLGSQMLGLKVYSQFHTEVRDHRMQTDDLLNCLDLSSLQLR